MINDWQSFNFLLVSRYNDCNLDDLLNELQRDLFFLYKDSCSKTLRNFYLITMDTFLFFMHYIDDRIAHLLPFSKRNM